MENDFEQIRQDVVQSFLKYQALKYDLSNITPLQNEYHTLSFEKDCYVGETKLEETTYICDAILPNFEVKNILLEVKKINNEWTVILKVNFFGLSLCVNHTKNNHLYFLGILNNFCPKFKIIMKENDLKMEKRRDNLI